MINIYVNVNKNEVIFRDGKLKLIKKYSKISMQNKKGIEKTVKLLTYAINKVFLDSLYNEKEYQVYINDKELIDLVKLENDVFLTKIDKIWHKTYSKTTVSQIGNFLKMLNKIKNKNIVFWEEEELYEIIDKKDALYVLQSECDIKIQDILHKIQKLTKEEIDSELCMKIVFDLQNLRIEREKIKKKIKLLEKEEKKFK